MHLNGHELRPIPGYPPYLACADGTIWKPHENKLIQLNSWIIDKQLIVKLHDINHAVQTLITRTFLGETPKGLRIYHFPDTSPWNCSLSNLKFAKKADLFPLKRCPRCSKPIPRHPYKCYCPPCMANVCKAWYYRTVTIPLKRRKALEKARKSANREKS